MSLTDGEREKLKALCNKFRLNHSIIQSSFSYRQNLTKIIEAAAIKLAILWREAKDYEKELSILLKQELGEMIVQKWIVNIGERIKEVLKEAENVISKADSIKTQAQKEFEEIQKELEKLKQLDTESAKSVDIDIKWVKLESNTRMFQIIEAYLEYAKHLLDDHDWLVKMLRGE
jgi:phenylalanyl-tRNA synthetase alpha subunit